MRRLGRGRENFKTMYHLDVLCLKSINFPFFLKKKVSALYQSSIGLGAEICVYLLSFVATGNQLRLPAMLLVPGLLLCFASCDHGISFRLVPPRSPGWILFLFLPRCEDGCVLSTESRRRGWPMVLAFAALTKVLESFSVVEGGSHRTSAYGSCRSWS